MPIVIGIDEAGYGPQLGPLVVGCSVWQCSPAAVSDNYWERLKEVVCRRPGKDEWRLPVNDSKQVHDRKCPAVLERPVLAFARCAGLSAASVAGLVEELCGRLPFGPHPPPWYLDLNQPLPLDPERSECTGIADKLRRCMARRGLRCCGLLAEVMPEHVFNQRVATVHNKADVLVEPVLRLIARATADCGDGDVHIHVDRLGGRGDYQPLLQQAFSDRHLHVLSITGHCSRYRLATQNSDWLIDFTIDGDQDYMPIALASMTAKYLREALMARFNAFWRGWLPELAPTAGYYGDARRFIRDIAPVVARAGLHLAEFVRER